MLQRCVCSIFPGHAFPGSSYCGLLGPISLELQQLRGRKRNLKAGLSKAQKAAIRQRREEKEAARKQYNFMQRTQIRRMKKLLSPSQQFPGRYSSEEEAGLPERPATNVFVKSAFRTQFYPVSYALSLHREMQNPAIYNNPNAPVRLRLELNMTTEKATKMVPSSEEIVPVPHTFKHNEKRALLAFVRDPALQELAVEKGAEIALGPDIIKKVIKGQFRIDDYDFCVAHVDMAQHIPPLRGILKSRFPTKLNGALGEDLEELIERFKSGVKVDIQGDPVYPQWGLCNAVVGKLSMSDEEIEANVSAVINAVCKHRSPALGPFINRALLMVIPGEAHFAIDVEKYIPVLSEEEIEKWAKRTSKKKKEVKVVKEVKEENPPEEVTAETANAL